VAVLADGERVGWDESPRYTGRVASSRNLGCLAPGSGLLVATKGLHAMPWGRPFPQHYLVVGPRRAEGMPSLRWDTVGVSGGGTSSIGG
jgi:hypothetical protein